MENNARKLISRDETMLVIIDVQERLLPVIHNNDRLVSNIVKLVRFAKIINLPILATEQEKLGATAAHIKQELPDLIPITKIEFNACRCQPFMEGLTQRPIKNIVMAGIESHICVTQTALQMLPDYNIHIVSDAVSSRSPDNVQVALGRLKEAGAVISSTEMVMYELLGKAGTAEFKATLPLVK